MTKDHSTFSSICEKELLRIKQYNEDNGIWPSINRIINRMLLRKLELLDFYRDVYQGLDTDSKELYFLFDCILMASDRTPERSLESRAERKKLQLLNEKIIKLAYELADTLQEKDNLDGSAFRDDSTNHILDLINGAASNHRLYNSFVRSELTSLHRFDLKYWPTISNCITALAEDIESASVKATDPLTSISTESQRPSKADLLRALFCNLRIYQDHHYIPRRFTLTDSSWASLVNCILDLQDEDLINAEYVKSLRQRDRGQKANSR